MRTFLSFQNLEEGVNDPAKLKAIFLAGGPGSGKSFVQNKVKGDLGFKVVNSDDLFEKGMKQHGLDPKMPPEEEEARDKVRKNAKEKTKKRHELYTQGRLGMIIDGTGKDHEEIRRHSDNLRSLGYDTHMIFVNTSLPVALERNKKRPRSVPEHIVTHSWNAVQNNIGHFQNHFGADHFHIVDNNKTDENLLHKLHKHVRKIATSAVRNPIGRKWIESQKPRPVVQNFTPWQK
jgi:dephospho-CoA kinase